LVQTAPAARLIFPEIQTKLNQGVPIGLDAGSGVAVFDANEDSYQYIYRETNRQSYILRKESDD